jgi:predicted DNA-binding antitoxin AbrB/MazE fold protein
MLGIIQRMRQVVSAIFKDGVFKPDQRPALADGARVRLIVEPVDGDKSVRREESWATVQRLWNASTFNAGGDRLTRNQLHERG